MLRKFLFLLLFLNISLAFAQAEKKQFAIYISSNHSAIKDDNTENRFGYGVSVVRKYILDNKYDLVTGVEFTRFVFYKKYLRIDNESFFSKVTYRLSNLSLPLLVRIKYNKFFIEPGAFFEINLGGNKEGNYFGTVKQLGTKAPNLYTFLLRTEFFPVNYGPQLGMGISMPFRKNELTLKGDFKYGLKTEKFYFDKFKTRYFRLMAGINLH